MLAALRRPLVPHLGRTSSTNRYALVLRRWQHDLNSKYADKLRQAAEEKGTTVEALRAQLREKELQKRRELAASAPAPAPASSEAQTAPASAGSSWGPGKTPKRQDSSPVQPLANIFNLARLLETPHTPEQVSALWTAYHASRSGGTGRGYLCASVPVKTYEAMLDSARRFPAFVLPLARDAAPDASGPQEQAYEMHFMQWGFHGGPAVPTFESVTSPFPTPAPAGPPNPPVATVLFTPLVEYKLHQSFATPHLVLTFHTELAQTHGIVLLRGELTPTATGGDGGDDGVGMRYHLSQADAQLLALGLQKFYLWNDGEGTKKREALLRTFHEQPAKFKWEELLEHTQSL